MDTFSSSFKDDTDSPVSVESLVSDNGMLEIGSSFTHRDSQRLSSITLKD